MIEQALLGRVLAEVEVRTALQADALATHLRGTFPGVHITVCNDDDIPARLSPVAGNDVCRLYYVDSCDHCLKLTTDAEAATGLVVALCDGDED